MDEHYYLIEDKKKKGLNPNNFFQQKTEKQAEILGLNRKNLLEKSFNDLEEKIFKIQLLADFIIPNIKIILDFIWQLNERTKTVTQFITAFDGKNEINVTLTVNFNPVVGEDKIILDIDVKNIALTISDKCVFKNPEYYNLKNWRFVL